MKKRILSVVLTFCCFFAFLGFSGCKKKNESKSNVITIKINDFVINKQYIYEYTSGFYYLDKNEKPIKVAGYNPNISRLENNSNCNDKEYILFTYYNRPEEVFLKENIEVANTSDTLHSLLNATCGKDWEWQILSFKTPTIDDGICHLGFSNDIYLYAYSAKVNAYVFFASSIEFKTNTKIRIESQDDTYRITYGDVIWKDTSYQIVNRIIEANDFDYIEYTP